MDLADAEATATNDVKLTTAQRRLTFLVRFCSLPAMIFSRHLSPFPFSLTKVVT